jgi:hypothetical protein
LAATRGETEALISPTVDAREQNLFRNSTGDVEVAAAGNARMFWF